MHYKNALFAKMGIAFTRSAKIKRKYCVAFVKYYAIFLFYFYYSCKNHLYTNKHYICLIKKIFFSNSKSICKMLYAFCKCSILISVLKCILILFLQSLLQVTVAQRCRLAETENLLFPQIQNYPEMTVTLQPLLL